VARVFSFQCSVFSRSGHPVVGTLRRAATWLLGSAFRSTSGRHDGACLLRSASLGVRSPKGTALCQPGVERSETPGTGGRRTIDNPNGVALCQPGVEQSETPGRGRHRIPQNPEGVALRRTIGAVVKSQRAQTTDALIPANETPTLLRAIAACSLPVVAPTGARPAESGDGFACRVVAGQLWLPPAQGRRRAGWGWHPLPRARAMRHRHAPGLGEVRPVGAASESGKRLRPEFSVFGFQFSVGEGADGQEVRGRKAES
jgi:hypothetical protein